MTPEEVAAYINAEADKVDPLLQPGGRRLVADEQTLLNVSVAGALRRVARAVLKGAS